MCKRCGESIRYKQPREIAWTVNWLQISSFSLFYPYNKKQQKLKTMDKKISQWARLFVMVSVFGAWSCSSTHITVEATRPEAALSDFTTFDFVQLETEGDSSSAFNESVTLIKSAVIQEMNARGLTQQADNPELQINLGIVVEEKTQTRQTSLSDPGEWTYIGQRNYKWKSRTVEVGTYKEGSITLHLVDNASNEAIWVGSIEGVVPRKAENRKEAIEEAVTSLFEEIDNKSE